MSRFVRWAALLIVPIYSAAAADFSHARHARLRLDCPYCHRTAKTGDRAGYPEASICANCHPRMTQESGVVTPAISVYQLAEFVQFSHARHFKAKAGCSVCHGDVWKMEVVEQAMPMTMKACVTCHEQTHAKTRCGTCHHLAGQ